MAGLVLLTNSFPYGGEETYIESEVPFYDDCFDTVTICALNVRKDIACKPVRKLEGISFRLITVPRFSKPIYLLKAPICFADRQWRDELALLKRMGRLSFLRFAVLSFFITRAHHEARLLREQIVRNGWGDPDGEGVIYSYRFDYQSYVAELVHDLFPHYAVVARGHGNDLYEERKKGDYIPLRNYFSKHLDRFFPICGHGLRYIIERHPEFKGLSEVAYLGTIDHGLGPVVDRSPVFRIMTCSRTVPIKRVDKLVKALSTIDDLHISWTHYGDGVLQGEIERLCSSILPANIKFNLKGSIPNNELMEEYSVTPYHLLVNLSESEGLPVSIMEAMSFGIPCLATKVCGTPEIVEDGVNGWLVSPDCTPEEAAAAIRSIAGMPDDEYAAFRKAARRTWEQKFNAALNHKRFVRALKEIAEEKR